MPLQNLLLIVFCVCVPVQLTPGQEQADCREYLSLDCMRQNERIVFNSCGGDLFFYHPATSTASRLTGAETIELDPRFSFSGNEVWFSEEDGSGFAIAMIDLATQKQQRWKRPPDTCDRLPTPHSTGAVAFARATTLRPYSMGGEKWVDWQIWVLYPEEDKQVLCTEKTFYEVNGIGFRGKDTLVFSAVDGGLSELFEVDMPTSRTDFAPQRPKRSRVGGQQAYSVSSSPDGQLTFSSDAHRQYYDDVFTAEEGSDEAKPLRVTAKLRNTQSARRCGNSIVFLGANEYTSTMQPVFGLWKYELSTKKLLNLAPPSLFTNPERFLKE